jgi:protein-L-isoaspartate O-methyltransferase
VTVHDKLTRLYEESPDPWAFETSWYERRKYALTLASLPRERYTSAYEPGCSIGVLTRQLAERCDSLLASDLIPRAVEAARRRVADLDRVRVERLDTPSEWPEGRFDLIVLSELAYFLQPPDVVELARRTGASLAEGGNAVAVHWRGPIDDWAVPAEQAHAILRDAGGLRSITQHWETEFLLEVFER